MEGPIVPFDLTPMFFGTDAPMFYLEIVFRTCVIYIDALVLIRWVGGRVIAQMSTVEFLLIFALGSAVGDAMFYPEVPLFHAMMVIAVVVVIKKVLDHLIRRFGKGEAVIDGGIAEVVKDGIIDVQTLCRHDIGKSVSLMSLREQGYPNLGEVRRAYLETPGNFSVFRAHPSKSGLRFEPAWVVMPPEVLGAVASKTQDQMMSCFTCRTATAAAAQLDGGCATFGDTVWTPAHMPDS